MDFRKALDGRNECAHYEKGDRGNADCQGPPWLDVFQPFRSYAAALGAAA
jgi:hypothetical protein